MRRFCSIFASRGPLSLILLLFLFQLSSGSSLAQETNSEAGPATRITLQEYRENIKHINADLSSMYSQADDAFNKDWSKQKQLDFEKEFYAEVPELLPPRETVEWQGMEVEVDNRWLHKRLEDLKKISIDSTERDVIVIELTQRLTALDAKFEELDAPVSATRSKDEEKQKLAEILNRVEYQAPEKKDQSALARWWDEFVKWLQNLFPKPQPVERTPLTIPDIFQTIVLIIIIALALAAIAFVIWRFLPYFGSGFRRRKEKKDDGDRIILGEKLGADESSATLFRQAELLAQEGNFRGAIRKGYIALLCELGDRKLVRLAQHKTNRDYLRDISNKHPELQGGVRNLTFMFENHWYGLASATEEEWGAFRENYRHSTSRI